MSRSDEISLILAFIVLLLSFRIGNLWARVSITLARLDRLERWRDSERAELQRYGARVFHRGAAGRESDATDTPGEGR